MITSVRLLPREQWAVLITDRHPGYVSWETYEATAARLRANWRPPRGQGGGAPREGRALLQGLLRCGRCGRIMQTGYSGTAGNSPRYVCARAKQLYAGEHVCQSIGGIRLEQVILAELFKVLSRASLRGTAKALADAKTGYRRKPGCLSRWRSSGPGGRRTAPAATYDRWSRRTGLSPAPWSAPGTTGSPPPACRERPASPARARRPVSLTSEELTSITTAAADIAAFFRAPGDHRPRAQAAAARSDLRGRRHHPRGHPRRGPEDHLAGRRRNGPGHADEQERRPLTKATSEDVIDLVRRLAASYDDKTIAAVLGKQHRRTATGLPWTRARVAVLRAQHRIPACQHKPGNVAPGGEDVLVVTISRKAEKILRVTRVTLYRWLRDGFITGEQMTPGAPWQIRIDQALRDKIRPEAPDGWLPLDTAAQALGVARQTVLHKVQRGELQAVHVNRGRRKGLRIQVKHDQAGLFDTPDKQKGGSVNHGRPGRPGTDSPWR